MRLRAEKGEESTSYGKIIHMHERIKNYTNREKGSLPSDDEMVEFGGELFETAFQGDVRRLYDEARARQQNRKLDIVFTSMIPWIGEKPWEFSYDTVRRVFWRQKRSTWCATSLQRFRLTRHRRATDPCESWWLLHNRWVLANCQFEQEVEVIRRGFLPLVDAGLVTVEVLARATPARFWSTSRPETHSRPYHRTWNVRRQKEEGVSDLRGRAGRHPARRAFRT